MTPQVFGQFLNVPLAINERGLRSLLTTAQTFREDSKTVEIPKGETIELDRMGNRIRRAEVMSDGTAYIPLKGVVSRGLGPMGEYYGFLDIGKFAAQVDEAKKNPAAQRIAIDIDSPGGTVLGTRDAAELVAEAAQAKPTMVYTDGLMASAAYYIGSAAHAIYSGSSAQVGSIGVYTYLADDTKFWEEECGTTWIVARSGKMKGMGIDAVTDEQIAMLQEEIDVLGEEFRSFVEQRRTISREDMEGQMFSGLQASQRGFVQGLAHTFSEALSRFKQYENQS